MCGPRYTLWLFVWIGIYAVLLFASIALIGHHLVAGVPALTAVALLPMLPAFGILALVMRSYRAADEFQKKIISEAIMFAFGVTAIITFSYGFLQRFVGAPDVSYFAVWPIMATAWVIGGMITRYRYR